MAVAFDAASSVYRDATSSGTLSHTCTGSDRLLVVGVCLDRTSSTVSTCTYATIPLTKLGEQNQGTAVRVELWYLVAPATGANNIVVNLAGGAANWAFGGVSFTGVSAGTPLGAAVLESGSTWEPRALVASNTDEIVVDVMIFDNFNALTVGLDQTQRWQVDISSGGCFGGMSTEAGLREVGMGWVSGSTNPGAFPWAQIAAAVKPVSPLPPASPHPIVFDAASSEGLSSPGTSISWNHTVGAGSNRALVALIGQRRSSDTQNVTAVTYGGTPLTFVGRHTRLNGPRVEIWILTGPPVGTEVVAVTLNLSDYVIAGAVSFTGVHPTAPTGTFAGGEASNTGRVVVNGVTSDVDELVVDIAFLGGPTYFWGDQSSGEGQTRRWRKTDTGNNHSAIVSTEEGKATVRMSASTNTSGAVRVLAIGAVSLKKAPPPAATGGALAACWRRRRR